jgi:hypothetical protein
MGWDWPMGSGWLKEKDIVSAGASPDNDSIVLRKILRHNFDVSWLS